jgi:hypothetical protein
MKKRVCFWLATLLGAIVLAITSPANALTFAFSYSALDGSFSGHGDFVTGNTGSPYLVIGVTGFAIDGNVSSAITGTSTFASADNRLYFPGTPHTDFFGISFSTVGAGAFNLYFNTVEFNGYGVISQFADATGMSAGKQVRLNVAATPLPAALPLFGGGFGAIGFLLWWTKRRNARAFATSSVTAAPA